MQNPSPTENQNIGSPGADGDAMPEPQEIDRTSIRRPPSGPSIMRQTWEKLLFLHWPIEPELLREVVPAGLEIDLWEGTAWIGVTPFTMRGIRPPLAPPLPLLSRSHELNVRAYVYRDGVPGIYFLSLDASNRLAVWAARLGFHLPYFHADISMNCRDGTIAFRSVRSRTPAAQFQAEWSRGERIPNAEPGTREFFLIERYCLYSERKGQLYRAQIHHRPWPLCTASLAQLSSTVLAHDGLPEPRSTPIIHAQAEPLHVRVWAPKRVS